MAMLVPWLIGGLLLLHAEGFVVARAVNVPWWDAWYLAEQACGAKPCTLSWLLVLDGPAGEHHMVIQRLYYAILGPATHWNEYTLALPCLPIVAIGAGLLIRRAGCLGGWEGSILGGATAVSCLSLAHWQNFVWAFEFSWCLQFLAFVVYSETATAFLAYGQRRDLAVACCAAAAASLCGASFLALEALALLQLVLAEKEYRRRALVLAVVVTALSAMYVGIGGSVAAIRLPTPVQAERFFAAFLGAPWAGYVDPASAMLAGAALLLVLGVAYIWSGYGVRYLVIHHPLVPLALALAAMVTLGRGSGWEVGAIYPRYSLFACLAFVGIARYAVDVARGRWRSVVAALMLAAALVGYVRAQPAAEALVAERNRSLLEFRAAALVGSERSLPEHVLHDVYGWWGDVDEKLFDHTRIMRERRMGFFRR